MAVDVNATRRQRAWDSIPDGASRTWTRQFRGSSYSLTLSSPQIRTLNGGLVFSVDVLVTKDGTPFYDDRLNSPNPPLGVRGADGAISESPLQAFREHVIDAVRAATSDLTVPHLMRDDKGRLLGDTLAVRSDTADGRVSSANATWTTALDGSSLSASTSGTTDDVRCTFNGSTYQIRQLFLGFDTSSLGSSATLSNGVFTLYGDTTAESNADGYDLQIRSYNWGGTLTTADYIDSNPQSNWTANALMAHMAVSSWVQTSGTANNLTVDSYSQVSKTGTTYVVVGLSGLGSGTPTGANAIPTRLADFSGTSSDPLLTVTYTVPPTGTIAATLQKALFSGSGAQTQTGTIAATLRKATASLTGAQTQSGSSAVTMQKATFSGSGSQAGGTEGTIATTLTRATASFTGAMQPSGTITATQQKATFAGTAVQAQSGTIAAVLQELTFAGTGTQTQTGTIAATLQKALFSGAGAQTQTGSIAATLQKVTASLVGVMQPEGAIAATLQKALFSGAGSQDIPGVIVATLTSATFSGAGAQVFIGTMTAQLQAALFEGLGVLQGAGFGTVLDSYAYGGTLREAMAHGITLIDGSGYGVTLTELVPYGGTLDDDHAYGGTVHHG